MGRLDIDRQLKLEPARMTKAILAIEKLDRNVSVISNNEINFYHKKELIKYFPYSGWATGSSIKDGRGLKNLLKQLK